MLGVPERKEKKHKSCRFCEWLQQWNTWKKGKGKARCIEKTDNDDFVAVFDQLPRVDGEILIISRRTYDDAYNDISDLSKFSQRERDNLFNILGDTISLMKLHLKAEKVYLYSFCEHWEEDEVAYEDKKTSEHLHFHLVPRYRGMRHKELAAEKIFAIPNKTLTEDILQALKDELLGKATKDEK